MSELEEARKGITAIDKEMARLFVERMRLAGEVAAYKKANGLPVKDAAREAVVLEKNTALVEDPVLQEYYVPFLKDVISYSCAYQERLMNEMKVAYCGVPGAFAHIAAKHLYPTARLVAFQDFESAYKACEDGDADAAILPLENSFAGDVGSVMDMAFSGSLYVNKMIDVEVCQNLLGVKGARKAEVRKVVSHPQALAQCVRYIRECGYEVVEMSNTAVAAQYVADLGDPSVAAIASAEAAAIYGLEVLERRVNTSSGNTTRFATFTRTRNMPVGRGRMDEHFILVFTVANEAGSLAKTLNIIGSHGFNMCNLHSRPMKELMWNYYFFVELEGNVNTPDGEDLLLQLGSVCEKLKLLGTYKRDSYPASEE
jgi:chorismate mutase/prephenate dehydratase